MTLENGCVLSSKKIRRVKQMVNQIGNNRALMVVAPSNEVAIVKDPTDQHVWPKKVDLFIAANKKELKTDWQEEKGSLIDLYI